MPMIPKPTYKVSALEEEKMFAVTYTYHDKDGNEFVDTWHISNKYMSIALDIVCEMCEAELDSGNWDDYEVISINRIRRGDA